jgi:hypothetical protein
VSVDEIAGRVDIWNIIDGSRVATISSKLPYSSDKLSSTPVVVLTAAGRLVTPTESGRGVQSWRLFSVPADAVVFGKNRVKPETIDAIRAEFLLPSGEDVRR